MRILVVEDDAPVAAFIRKGLESENYEVGIALDGEQGNQIALDGEHELIILDLNLPKLDGITVLRNVRPAKPQTPVLVLTARSRVEDRVEVLNSGADDCLNKPFSYAELSARVRALLRRGRPVVESTLRVGDLFMDRVERRVERGGRRIELTTKEFALLEYLMRNAGRRITRSMIIEHVWNMHFDSNTNLVDVYVNYLRVVFDAHLVSVEQLTFREFLARVPDISYLASFRVLPLGVMAAIQLDLTLAFPIVDLLLGGRGRSSTEKREVTEIEEQIMEGVVRILCHELQTAWTSINVTFEFAERLLPTQMQRLMPSTDKTLCLSFEIRMPESRGMLNVSLPAVVSNQLLRTLDRDGGYDARRSSPEVLERMRIHAQEFRFRMELAMPNMKVPVSTVMNMKPGDIIPLPQRADEPSIAQIGRTRVFTAAPVRAGARRAARILDLCAESQCTRQNL